jgi:pSer/pThr/pTyr-binding forkhead associated (FHA) protein
MQPRFTIGRDRHCDVPIEDDSVSRRHAEIWLGADGSLHIADLGSSNGTKIVRDGRSSRVEECALMAGDQVRLGVVTIGLDELVDRVEQRHPGALRVRRAARIRCVCGVLKTPGEACLGCGGSNG